MKIDSIKQQPLLLTDKMQKKPKDYDVSKYTQEVFRMFATQDATEVTLLCENYVMKSIIDRFGSKVRTKVVSAHPFCVKVKARANPTFYRWGLKYEQNKWKKRRCHLKPTPSFFMAKTACAKNVCLTYYLYRKQSAFGK